MIRNLDNRVEVATPIYDPELREELKTFFETQWQDNTKARALDLEGKNELRPFKGRKKCRAQIDIYKQLAAKS